MTTSSQPPCHPASYFLGRLLQQLRQQRGIRNATAVASQLGISPSTYRLIEAGRLPIPSYCAPPIAALFELSVSRVAAVIAIGSFLAESRTDHDALRARCDTLGALDGRLRWIGATLAQWREIERLPTAGAKRLAAEEAVLMRIAQVLRSDDAIAPTASADSPLIAAISRLPPIHHDALAEWVERQAQFSPVFRFDRQLDWLAERAARVVSIRALVSDPIGLVYILRRDAMILDLVRNPFEPRLEIAIDSTHVTQMERDIRSTLRAAADRDPLLTARSRAHRQRSVDDNVHVKAADAAFLTALAPIQAAAMAGNAAALSRDRRAHQYRDVWVVDFRSTGRSSLTHRVAFLCLYERLEGAPAPRAGYAIALDEAITADCVRRFDTAWAAG